MNEVTRAAAWAGAKGSAVGRRVGLVVALLCAGLVAAAPAGATPGQMSFNSTGAEQSYTVPAGVFSVNVQAIGAPGASDDTGNVGGFGGQASGVLSVWPGETLYVEVGASGTSGAASSGAGTGGFNGGGSSGGVGGGGGGASDVRTVPCGVGCPFSPSSLASRLLVAGGGGGAGAGAFSGTGGAAGSVGEDGAFGGNGGGGATTTSAGTGGNSSFCVSPAVETPGGPGSAGGGGAGAADTTANGGGGGGGGGEYGGGGGGSCAAPSVPNAGGGGGGSSFAASSVSGAAFGSDSTGTPLVTITPLYPIAQAGSVQDYGTQPQSTLSPPQTLTISNGGAGPLSITGLSFGGTNPGDFLVGSSTCGGQIGPGNNCQVSVSFAPQGQGSRSATLVITSNDPASPITVALTGTGGQLPQGPAGGTGAQGSTGPKGDTGTKGDTGAIGPQGPTGARGPQGPAGTPGQIDLLVCGVLKTQVIKVNGKKVKIKTRTCTGRLVTGKLTVLGAAANQASVVHNGVVFAAGHTSPATRGHAKLVLKVRRRLTAGSYSLNYRVRQGRRWVTKRERITLNW